MKKIYLTRKETQVLRLVHSGCGCPETFTFDVFVVCVDELERKCLVCCAWAEGHYLEDVRMSDRGKAYMALNPSLRNPVDWKWIITTVFAIVGMIAGILALFIAYRAL